tara:strand:- start:34 stop:705 length:672 start_codon:yes stop_codon:yes gene_type:complete
MLDYKDDANSLISDDFIISPKIENIPRFKPKINLAVLASGNGSNFEAISKAISNNFLDAKISILIVNKEDCLAISKAKSLGIIVKYINHKEYRNRELYDSAIIKILSKYDIEGIIMAGWMRIVSSVLIDAFPDRILNIHPSLLPSFKGANAIKKAIDSGVKITGCSVHRVVKEVDSGEIIAQAALNISDKDTYNTLTKKIQAKEHEIFPYAIALAARRWRDKS